jgi:IS66 C-terminal element
MYTLIQTAKLNDIDPQAWLADTLSKIDETPQTGLGKLLPWNWMSDRRSPAPAPRQRGDEHGALDRKLERALVQQIIEDRANFQPIPDPAEQQVSAD